MNLPALYDGLLTYLYLVIIVTFHEFGHAWMANWRGDDTPRLQGRITLNPVAHIDMLGTVVIPLVVVLLGATGNSRMAGLLIGWGRPVQFNPGNLRRRRYDSTLIALAGPAMNVVLALLVMALIWVGFWTESAPMREACRDIARLSLFLGFFNLLPIPPLDGSHVARGLIGFSEETYLLLSRYGFFLILVAIQLPPVTSLLSNLTSWSFAFLALLLGLR
jgi:Zn-dependent protease